VTAKFFYRSGVLKEIKIAEGQDRPHQTIVP